MVSKATRIQSKVVIPMTSNVCQYQGMTSAAAPGTSRSNSSLGPTTTRQKTAAPPKEAATLAGPLKRHHHHCAQLAGSSAALKESIKIATSVMMSTLNTTATDKARIMIMPSLPISK
ncbi:hypothetical protein D3C87_1374200 [compost metagenome]